MHKIIKRSSIISGKPNLHFPRMLHIKVSHLSVVKKKVDRPFIDNMKYTICKNLCQKRKTTTSSLHPTESPDHRHVRRNIPTYFYFSFCLSSLTLWRNTLSTIERHSDNRRRTEKRDSLITYQCYTYHCNSLVVLND